MTVKFEYSVDEIGMNIIDALQTDARVTYSDIGRKVGLSSPAVAERVYKMEEAGIIKGYHADVAPEFLGHAVMAFVTLTTQSEKYPQIFKLASRLDEVMECHHISGQESLILKLGSGSVSHLDELVRQLSRFGETKTSIVLSTPVEKKKTRSLKKI